MWPDRGPGRFFLNLQGDEIPADPELLRDLIEPFVESGAEMGTLKRALHTAEELQNPAVVKVVTDRQGRALYFSRAPIPLVRDDHSRQAVKGLHYIHLGVYIYTRETLLRLASLADGWSRGSGKAGAIARPGQRDWHSGVGNTACVLAH